MKLTFEALKVVNFLCQSLFVVVVVVVCIQIDFLTLMFIWQKLESAIKNEILQFILFFLDKLSCEKPNHFT